MNEMITLESIQLSQSKLELKAKLFRGFGDYNRLKILEILIEADTPLNVSKIVELMNISQPNASSHLRCLRDCCLVTKKRKGKEIYYELANKKIKVIMKATDQLLSTVYDEIYNCTRY